MSEKDLNKLDDMLMEEYMKYYVEVSKERYGKVYDAFSTLFSDIGYSYSFIFTKDKTIEKYGINGGIAYDSNIFKFDIEAMPIDSNTQYKIIAFYTEKNDKFHYFVSDLIA